MQMMLAAAIFGAKVEEGKAGSGKRYTIVNRHHPRSEEHTMSFNHSIRRRPDSMPGSFLPAALAGIVLAASGCSFFQLSPGISPAATESRSAAPIPAATVSASASAPTPDPRVGLRGGAFDAAEAAWNLRVLSETRPSEKFAGGINSDLAFLGNYVTQGSFSGYQVWDISNPKQVTLKTAYFCPASQSDVSVYKNLLFVSGEDLSARVDCGAEGVKDTVSKDRLRGIRIFDITDINAPKNVGNVQTCRGSHTHSLLVDPKDPENVYIVSGSGRRALARASRRIREAFSDKDPNSALFRIESHQVPLAHRTGGDRHLTADFRGLMARTGIAIDIAEQSGR
jgi:hypothetical protein